MRVNQYDTMPNDVYTDERNALEIVHFGFIIIDGIKFYNDCVSIRDKCIKNFYTADFEFLFTDHGIDYYTCR